MRKWLVRILVLALLVAAGYFLRSTVWATQPIVVEVTAVERGLVEATVANTKAGTVRARRRAKLSPGTSGVVTELAVKRGERVDAQAVLLRLDDATQSANHALTERALEVAEASHARYALAVQRAARELKRHRELAQREIVSVDRFDQLESVHALAVADEAVAAARVGEARAAVEAARAELDKTVLRAPFDAIIAEVSVELGEWVTPSVALLAAPDLIDAIDPRSLYISAPIDEVDAGRLAPGQRARVTIDSHPGQSFEGRVVEVAPYVLDLEQQNRTVEVEVELEDEALAATLLPGTSADVELVLEVKEDALHVPAFALLDGDRVFVIEEGQAVERQVETGLASWTEVEILSGLEEGEEVIVRFEAEDLEPGAEVELEGASAAEDSSAGEPES